ncbi:F-box domain-containing protein with Leucine-rich repeat [Orpheovirus IHUMI-LCC2]|uniref:F-box domain-containing protein with Leucine-rich repeat n=1 Tax=Orpheovirus IHUMI-LCC2 TaxID=2023057 RepID=A0A2I2L3R3_9VIRU|nr:F-box domain-containing protein with Leucine-rich repeat [Orpheovirus IHUMI-LCC2]SNW62163.1 F-box domain-containing protein with Leucine-rich repeat [Orpheovirus IHUMI-LCC2]
MYINNMDIIPNEIIFNIFKYLDNRIILNMAYVSKHLSTCILSYVDDRDIKYILRYAFMKDKQKISEINIDKISTHITKEFVTLYIRVFEEYQKVDSGNVLLFLDTVFSLTINPIHIYYITNKFGNYLHKEILTNYMNTSLIPGFNRELLLNPGINEVLDMYVSSFTTNKFYNICNTFKHTYTFIYDHIIRHNSVTILLFIISYTITIIIYMCMGYIYGRTKF